MPTRDNCAQLEALLEATAALVELKKVVDKVEYDIRVLKSRVGDRVSEAAAAQVEESEDAKVIEDAVEGGDASLAEGRAHSVVSTRSGRSRKQVSAVNFFNHEQDLLLGLDTAVNFGIISGYNSYSFDSDGHKKTETQPILTSIFPKNFNKVDFM